MNSSFAVQMKNIKKIFPGVIANDNVNFELRHGEIHALLGENGSGKSTLMSILSGIYKPDEGEIYIEGNKVNFRSPKDAINAGIGMIHQHFKLVETFTVAENILLGSKCSFFYNAKDVEKQIGALAKKYGLHINLKSRIWQLSVGEKQRVEILKMLYRGSNILILDEPTSVLTPQEAKELFDNLKKMAQNNRAIIVITHKMKEVMEIADRVTVLRNGKAVATLPRKEISQNKLAGLMIGRNILALESKKNFNPGEKVLELVNVCTAEENGRHGLKGVSLCLHSGEILGIAGVAGNGQLELAESITGLRSVCAGSIILKGRTITNMTPRMIIEQGISYIPEDRIGTGLAPGLNALDNLILKEYRSTDMCKGPFINYTKARKKTRGLISRFNISISNTGAPVSLLSGGNLQKLLLAREISSEPLVIVAVYPVRGLDIGATQDIHKLLLEQRDKGSCILLISEDLDEIFKLSDRIAVMYEGTITESIPADKVTLEEIGVMMMGSAINKGAAS